MKSFRRHKKELPILRKKTSSLFKKILFSISPQGNKGKEYKKHIGFRSCKSKGGLLQNPYNIYKTPKSFYIRFRDKYFLKIAIVFFILQIFILFFSPYFKVNNITIAGLESIREEDINGIINEYFKKRRFLIFSNKNLFFLNSNKLIDTLSDNYSIERLDLEKNYLNKSVHLIIKERMPVLIFVDNGKYYMTDSLGYVISKADPDEVHYLDLPLLYNDIDLLSEEIKIGNQSVQESLVDSVLKMDYIFAVKTNIRVASYKLSSSQEVVLHKQIIKQEDSVEESEGDITNVENEKPEDENKEKLAEVTEKIDVQLFDPENFYYPELSIITNEGWKIYFGNEPFKKDNQVDVQLNNFVLLLERQNNFKTKKLTYVDLRFINKIFFK